MTEQFNMEEESWFLLNDTFSILSPISGPQREEHIQ